MVPLVRDRRAAGRDEPRPPPGSAGATATRRCARSCSKRGRGRDVSDTTAADRRGPGPGAPGRVGGVGMSGLARLLLTRGIPVVRQRAARSGPRWPACGRSAAPSTCATIRPIWTVWTRSSTPPPSRPTTWSWSRRAARGLRVLHRSEALAAAMAGRRTIAVAGTHGKTTTTSMVTLDPAARRARPVVRDRRRDLRGRLQRPPRHRRALRRRGRRERPLVPATTARTSRSSPTSTPTTSTPTATWPASRTRSSSSAAPGRARTASW